MMKKAKIVLIVSAVVFITSSCFLFRPTHERCPAYGQEQYEQNQLDFHIEASVQEKS